MALQAISEFALYFRNSNPTASVTVTPLDPPEKSTSVDININNAVLLQFIEVSLFYFLQIVAIHTLCDPPQQNELESFLGYSICRNWKNILVANGFSSFS